MENLNELQKDIICDKIEKMIDNFNSEELEYAIYIINWWKEERERQEEELEELEEKWKD